MYQLGKTDEINGQSSCIIKIGANMSIPFAPDNTDYQEYLKWVAEGGVPEPADSQE
jgi:hypothetical protein